MKYAIVIFAFGFLPTLSPAASSQSAVPGASSDPENCAYATQSVHTVSERYYERLLSRLEGKDRKQRKQRPRGESTGQR